MPLPINTVVTSNRSIDGGPVKFEKNLIPYQFYDLDGPMWSKDIQNSSGNVDIWAGENFVLNIDCSIGDSVTIYNNTGLQVTPGVEHAFIITAKTPSGNSFTSPGNYLSVSDGISTWSVNISDIAGTTRGFGIKFTPKSNSITVALKYQQDLVDYENLEIS